MSQNNPPVDTTVVEVKESKPGIVARARTNAPRILKAAGLTAAALLVGGAVGASMAKSKQAKNTETYDDGFDGTVLVADSPSED